MKKVVIFLLSIAALGTHFESFSAFARLQRLSGPAARYGALMRSAPRGDLSRLGRFYSGRSPIFPSTARLAVPPRSLGYPSWLPVAGGLSVPAATAFTTPSISPPSFFRSFSHSVPTKGEAIQISPDLSISIEEGFGDSKGKIIIKTPDDIDQISEDRIESIIDTLTIDLQSITNLKSKYLQFDPGEKKATAEYRRKEFKGFLDKLETAKIELEKRIQATPKTPETPWYKKLFSKEIPSKDDTLLSDYNNVEKAIQLIKSGLLPQIETLDTHYEELIPIQEEKDRQIMKVFGNRQQFFEIGKGWLGLRSDLSKEDIANYKSGKPMIDPEAMKKYTEAAKKSQGGQVYYVPR